MSSRYLTPSKIALLSLISIYCDGQISPDDTLGVLSFVSARLIPPGPAKHLTERIDSFDVFGTDLRKLFQASATSSNQLTLWDVWGETLWRIENLDDLFDFFNGLDLLFYPRHDEADAGDLPVDHRFTVLARTSVIGIFVRRARLEWERLSFQDADALWQSFVRFRDPQGSNGRKPAGHDGDAFDVAEFDAGSGGLVGDILRRAVLSRKGAPAEADKAGDLSSDDMEKLLEFQIDRMQKYGLRVPVEVRGRLYDTIKTSAASTNLSNYERFLDAWYAGDYLSSFDNLHRFHDYAMHAKDRSQYQYALLNMAILQADFGCYDESLAAMDEAVTASRDNKDMACLNYALSWLHHFRNVYRGHLDRGMEQSLLGTDTEGLAFLKAKAQENRMWSVMVTAILDEARLYMFKGHAPRNAIVRVMEATELTSMQHVQSLEASIQLVQSSIFNRLGINTMSVAYCNLIPYCYRAETPIADLVRSNCRVAYHLSSSGQPQHAAKVLNALPPDALRNFQLSQLVSAHEQLQALQTALNRNDLDEAKELIDSLLSANTASVEPEVRFLASLLSLKLLLRQNNYSRAFAQASRLLDEAEKAGADTHQYIRLLSAKALIFARAGKPQKGFTLALRAAGAAYSAKLLPALWEAVAVLSGVLVGMQNYSEALRLAESVLYQAMETDDLEIVSLLLNTLADAEVGLAEQRQHDIAERDEALRRAQQWLDRVETVNTKLGDIVAEADIREKQVILARMLREPAASLRKLEAGLEQALARLGLDVAHAHTRRR